jgi:hypothetical protein
VVRPMTHSLRVGLVGLVLLGAGCALFVAKETLYLESAQGRATQAEVQQELGAPRLKAHTPEGEPVWLYEVRHAEAGSQNVLTFDRQGVLRRWTHKSEKHGGERMPTYCVTDGFKPGS